MDNKLLKQFYDFEAGRETVKAFLIECLKELTVENAFDGKATTGIKEAKEAIDMAFSKLEEKYGIISEPIISNSR